MDQFLINIEKYKFPILGTILVHIVIVIASSFTQVQNVFRMPPEEISIDIPLDEIEFEPKLEEILDLKKEPLPNQTITNLVTDANDTREKSYENYSINKQEVSDEVFQNAKELERQFFEEAAANNPSNTVPKNDHVPIETKSDLVKMNNDNGAANKSFAGEVMISFDLINRKAFSLPNPGYTCNNSGVIVIEVKVGADGKVKSTNFLENRSTSATDCLVERAIKYASRSRFNSTSGGSQTGTITYKFMGQ